MKSFTMKTSYNEDVANELRYYSNSLFKLYVAIKDSSLPSPKSKRIIDQCVDILHKASVSVNEDIQMARRSDVCCSADLDYLENL